LSWEVAASRNTCPTKFARSSPQHCIQQSLQSPAAQQSHKAQRTHRAQRTPREHPQNTQSPQSPHAQVAALGSALPIWHGRAVKLGSCAAQHQVQLGHSELCIQEVCGDGRLMEDAPGRPVLQSNGDEVQGRVFVKKFFFRTWQAMRSLGARTEQNLPPNV
jgi:hypothetical protein